MDITSWTLEGNDAEHGVYVLSERETEIWEEGSTPRADSMRTAIRAQLRLHGTRVEIYSYDGIVFDAFDPQEGHLYNEL